MPSTTALELKTFLDAIGTLGALYIGYMPPTPDAVGVIYEYGGQIPEHIFGNINLKNEKPALQIVFRGEAYDYSSPRTKADTAWRALGAITPGVLGAGITTVYFSVTPQQSPRMIRPIDENNRHYIGFNFYVYKEVTL